MALFGHNICVELGSRIVKAATWMRIVCWSVSAVSRGLSFLAVAIMRKGRKEEMDKETDESVRPNFAKPELAGMAGKGSKRRRRCGSGGNMSKMRLAASSL